MPCILHGRGLMLAAVSQKFNVHTAEQAPVSIHNKAILLQDGRLWPSDSDGQQHPYWQ
jgi:hypothetical protein